MKTTLSVSIAVVLAVVPAAASSEGKALYNAKCASCHGIDGVPKKLGAGSKAFGDPEFKKLATVKTIMADARDGKGKMKAIKNLSDEEAVAIAEYILTIVPAK